jgi:beta-glucosidase
MRSPAAADGPYQYPFQNPDLPLEQRVDNIVSLMNLDEKVACLGTRPNVPRLGIQGTGHVEGLHGLALGGPGGWGRPTPIPTTQFSQAIGMGETWDPDLIRKAGGVEGNETRYIYQSKKRGGLVVRAPNADLGRDPRWGRTEECFGEDPFFNGKMVTAMAGVCKATTPSIGSRLP